MKKAPAIFLATLMTIFFSCEKDQYTTLKQQWVKIEFEEEGALYSMHGNISEFLLVGSSNNILKTEDQGKNWKTVLINTNTIGQFVAVKDTILALSNYLDYYSLDEGETWQAYQRDLYPTREDLHISSTNLYYKLQGNSDGELATPSFVLESADEGAHWENIFPYDHYIYSLYLDEDDRLYIGINGWLWKGTNQGFDANSGNKAILYYLEK